MRPDSARIVAYSEVSTWMVCRQTTEVKRVRFRVIRQRGKKRSPLLLPYPFFRVVARQPMERQSQDRFL